MAIPTDTVWEVRTTGSDTACGGGFAPSKKGATGVNYSQQDSVQTTISAVLSAVGTTTLTATGSPFTNLHLGNLIQITGGTLTSGFYCIQGFTDANNVVLDRSPGTGTLSTGYIGGALANPGTVSGKMVGGNKAWIKSGTYTINSSSNNVPGGVVALPAGVNNSQTAMLGYGTTRGDSGRPLFQASSITSASIFNCTNQGIFISNIMIDGAGLSPLRGFNLNASGGIAFNCKATNFTNGAFVTGAFYFCEASGCTTVAVFNTAALCFGCYSHDNNHYGFSECQTCIFCISANNTGGTYYGFYRSAASGYYSNCIAIGNAGSGFYSDAFVAGTEIINCIAWANGGYGIEAFYTDFFVVYNFAAGGNTSGNFIAQPSSAANLSGVVTLSRNPFNNSASKDFSLNTFVDGGGLCRSKGISVPTLAGILNASFQDIGACQHADYVGGAVGVGF